MSAGAFRQRLAIERPTSTADGGGGRATDWSTVATVFAAVRTLRAGEREELGRLDGVATHRVTVRAGVDLRGGDRLIAGGRTLRVLAVRDDDAGRHRVALAEEAGR